MAILVTTAKPVSELRRAAAAGCERSRDELIQRAFNHSIRAARSMTRDNRLYEPDDVTQQVWLYAMEAVSNDKGIGDALAFYRFHILNRLRDWMGAAVRRHAFCECTKCGSRSAIKPVKERACRDCGASGSDISSVTIVDRGAEWTNARSRSDDHSVLVVKEFWDSLSELEQAVMVDRLNGRDRVEIAVRNTVSSSAVTKIVNGIGTKYKERFALAA